ncbi:hypothetical protein SISNIDRAFT_455517 [Sistotremastrum niveocremeum HHB9708]|nr:hypothetical protein SISNIDRAFT_455517 [Sistotremastrum niveocremeum HHB9708]
MSSFFGSSASASSSPAPAQQSIAAQVEGVKQRVQNELALHDAQELINKINEKCFFKCVTKPSSSLSSSEETCLSRCMQRYMEAYNIVNRTYRNRLMTERANSQAAAGQPSDLLT